MVTVFAAAAVGLGVPSAVAKPDHSGRDVGVGHGGRGHGAGFGAPVTVELPPVLDPVVDEKPTDKPRKDDKPPKAEKPGKGRGNRSPKPEGAPGRDLPVTPPAVVATTPAPAPQAPVPATEGPTSATPVPAVTPGRGRAPAADRPGAPVSQRLPAPAGPTPLGSTGGPSLAGPGASFAALGGALPAAGSSSADDSAPPRRRARPRPAPISRTVVRTVRRAVEVVPGFVWALVAGLAAFSLLATGASSFMAGRARRLSRQREALLQDVGLLQQALLPDAPEQIEGVAASAVYRPATVGPPGGDFHDVFALDAERLGIVVGRVSTTGRRALGVTALIRHVLRAYLEGGLQPRNALQVGADVLEHHLGPGYACVTLAIFDRGTSRLTYAGAGMPAPVVLGSAAFEPVTACAAPPIGMGVPTGIRQTSVLLPPGALACLYTDGLLDARTSDGRYGYRRAWHAVESLGPADGADVLVDRVAAEADASTDDVAAVLLRVADPARAPGWSPEWHDPGERRVEEVELDARALKGELPGLFLRDCGVPSDGIPVMVEDLRETGRRLGGAVLRVRYGAGVPEAEARLRTTEVLTGVSSPAVAAAGPSA